MKRKVRGLTSLMLAGLIFSQTFIFGQVDDLKAGFGNPPNAARPRVWWHWMDGNITKEGIQKDLEWMKRIGIGGVQQFDVARLFTPKVVGNRLVYMTPEWKEAFSFAAAQADKLGLEMTTHSSPGWSVTGGPWVKPEEAMKKFVWSETRVEGGRPFTGKLSKPPSVAGPFQNIKSLGESNTPKPDYYADSAIIAYRVPERDVPLSELKPKVTSSGGQFNVGALTDGDFETANPLPKAPMNEKAWIQFEFDKGQTIYSFTLGVKGASRDPLRALAGSGLQLEASFDGQQFHAVAAAPTTGAIVNTMSFPPETARFFRVTFLTQPEPPPLYEIPGVKPPPPPTKFDVTELVLHTAPRINRFEEKTAFGLLPELYSVPSPKVPATDVVSKAEVIDLTEKMRPDGTINWTPPAGNWVILRLGYSLTGAENKPAPVEATGLEVDKLNRRHVKKYLDNYLGQLKETLGPLMGQRGLQNLLTDSWEAGPQNWTEEMIVEFTRRRGYDMRPWLPVLTGRVVESSESSDQFLWDFRRTLSDLVAENHYDQMTASLKVFGMGRYAESHEGGRAFIGDGMEVKRSADVPMGATWIPSPRFPATQYEADIRESASVAHIYGQNLVAAESLTVSGFGANAFKWSPETLKPTADQELASGLNRFVIHTSVHQPLMDKAPGLSLGPVGQWFTRNETWAEYAEPWITYLARSSYLLQQGNFVADVIYFYGEDTNITALFGDKSPLVPAGYNFDYVNADALKNKLSVKNGRLTTPSGMSYRLLALDPNSKYMSLPVLRKIRELVDAGAVVVGGKPLATPSLSDDQKEFRAIVDGLWGSGSTPNTFGKGKVYGSQTIGETLTALKISPDFEFTRTEKDTLLRFVHRKLPGGEIYWVNNRQNRAEELEATFRVSGKEAEVWYPETGRIAPAGYRIGGERTTVPLRLNPNEAVFVVFRKNATSKTRVLPREIESLVSTLDENWKVSFEPNRGAPAKVTFDKLISWSESSDPGVKYFSGTATYSRQLQVPDGWMLKGSRLWLDLGQVKDLAEVVINGKSLGIVWKTPFRLDVTDQLKPGENTVEVKVTNLWVNRLIGDQQPGVTQKYTFTTWPYLRPDSALLPSGLLGPVKLFKVIKE